MFKPTSFLLFFSLLALPCLVFAEESMTITTYYPSPYGSYNDLYVANRLGIGTTGPMSTLHVGGQSGVPAITLGEANFTDGAINTPHSLSLNIDSNNDSTNEVFEVATNRVSRTGGSVLMTIKESGNVGIGTTGPARPLDIQTESGGHIRLQRLTASGGGAATCSISVWASSCSPGWTQIGSSNGKLLCMECVP